jgi:hypothetical protein
MFYIPLAYKEKWHIAYQDAIRAIDKQPDLSHGDAAKHLNRLFSKDNKGTRSRMTVYLFRGTDEYKIMRAGIEEKERAKAKV